MSNTEFAKIKNQIVEIKIAVDDINSRLDTIEQRISDLKGRAEKIYKNQFTQEEGKYDKVTFKKHKMRNNKK